MQPEINIRLCPYHTCDVFWCERLIEKFVKQGWLEKLRRTSKGKEAFVAFIDYRANMIG